MQLKVCNPQLSFFLILSVWTKTVMKCCAAGDRCKFIKGSESRRDWRCYFIAEKKKKKGEELQLVYMNCGIIVQQNIYRVRKKAQFLSTLTQAELNLETTLLKNLAK